MGNRKEWDDPKLFLDFTLSKFSYLNIKISNEICRGFQIIYIYPFGKVDWLFFLYFCLQFYI